MPKSNKKSQSKFKLNLNSNKQKLLLFVISFALIGGAYFAYRSFAAESVSGLCKTPRGYSKVACFAAADGVEVDTPEVEYKGAVLSDSAISGSGPGRFVLFTDQFGNRVWNAPKRGSVKSDDYKNLKDRNTKLCFTMQGYRGDAKVITVLKSGSSTLAQKEHTVSSSEYRDYCIDRRFKTNTLENARFEAYSTGGKVKIWYMTFSKSAPSSSSKPSTSNPSSSGSNGNNGTARPTNSKRLSF